VGEPRLPHVVDTHTHLGLCEPPDRELVDAARDAGVERLLSVGIDEESNRAAIGAAVAHPEVHAAVGCHPNSATGFDDRAAGAIEQLAAESEVRAIGETGLDFYRDRAPREDQRRAFAAQIEIARRTDLPLVIHVRDEQTGNSIRAAAASDSRQASANGARAGGRAAGQTAVSEVFTTLADSADGVTVILHCYSAGADRAEEAAANGWYCSFAGNLTYPKAVDIHEAARLVPLELLLVETDAPFLSPQPLRGKPNQPANVVATAKWLAELRGLSYAELETAIDANAATVFGW
jgi:TatD DNase family protein